MIQEPEQRPTQHPLARAGEVILFWIPVVVPLVLLGGAAGGAVWGAIPGVLKAYNGVNEILSTIMLNSSATVARIPKNL